MHKLYFKKIDKQKISFYIDHFIADYISKKSVDLIKKRNAKQLAIFANDYIGIQINQFGYFEQNELDVLFEILSPLSEVFSAGVALDIGANVGNHSAYFSDKFAAVHAYEPNPRTYTLLEFNTHFLENVTCHAIGLGDKPGHFELHQDIASPGLASIVMRTDTTAEPIKVPVETLDRTHIPEDSALCFVKIDVEGFEYNVITGGQNTLLQKQPVIVIEQHISEFGNGDTSPAIRKLKQMGYTFLWQKKRGTSSSWILRRLRELLDYLLGNKIEIFASDNVPPANYTMLIAIPPKFKERMKL